MAEGPKFGSVGRSTRYSSSQTAEKLDLTNGFNIEQYYRKKTDNREETIEKLLSYGIAGKEDTVRNSFGRTLSSVTLTETEDCIMHESWTGRTADTSDTTQGGALVAVDAVLYTRKEERYVISGYGALPELAVGVKVKVGDYVATPLVIAPATETTGAETVSITVPAEAFLENVSVEGENTSWSTFSLTFVKYTAQPTPAAPLTPMVSWTNPLNEDVIWVDEVTPGYWTKTTRTTTLTAEGFASVAHSVELHEKHANSLANPA